MSSRLLHARAYQWLAALSLAVYGTLGVFGHGLHGLMPCSDGSCGEWAAAADDHCCCCDHAAPATRAAADSEVGGPQFGDAGHDPNDCSLCVLLAKIKVGRLAIFKADVRVELSCHEVASYSAVLSSDHILSGAPRGPPTA